MRRTNALRIISLAATFAAPTFVLAGNIQSSGTADEKGVLQSNPELGLQMTSPASVNWIFAHSPQVTNGKWNAIPASGTATWGNAANWNPAVVPNGPTDTVEVQQINGASGGSNIQLDVNYTVQSLSWTTPYQYDMLPPGTGAGGTQTTVTNTSGLMDVQNGPRESPNSFFGGQAVRVNVAGTSGLTKNGSAPLQLTALTGAGATPTIASTFSGGITINGGSVSHANDPELGDLGQLITLNNGGTLRSSGGTSAGVFRTSNFVLGSGDGNFQTFSNYTVSGVISGGGNLTKNVFTAGSLILINANTYTGQTIIRDNGVVNLDGTAGTILNTSTIQLGGALQLNSNGTNGNRLSDTGHINSYGGVIVQTGKAGAGSSENAGNLHLLSGNTQVFVNDTTATTTRGQVTFGSIDRPSASTMFIRGRNLGNAPGSGVGNVFVTAAPTQVGGGGAAGTTNRSIIPWVMATNDAAAVASNVHLATYDGTGGIKPLDPAANEYATTLAAAAATDNVRITAAESLSGAKTINSLVISHVTAGQAVTAVNGTGPLTITSGAILQTGSFAGGATGEINVDVNFGAAEGIVQSPAGASGLEISGVINGTGGLTSGRGNLFLTNTSNTYTGQTTINSGFVIPLGNLNNTGAPSAMGQSTSAIKILTGSEMNLTATTGLGGASSETVAGILMNDPGSVCDRNIDIDINSNVFPLNGIADIGNNLSDGDQGVTYNGNINIGGGQVRLNGSAPTAAPAANDLTKAGMIFNGVISGPGRIADLNVTVSAAQNPLVHRFNGANTYTGPTSILSNIFQLGSDSVVSGPTLISGPLGVGTVFFNGAAPATVAPFDQPFGALQAFGADRTLANPVVYRSTANFVGTQKLTLSGVQDMGGTIRRLVVQTPAGIEMSNTVQYGGLLKYGVGALILSGSNTFAGQAQVADGVLSVRNSAGLGTSLTGGVSSNGATFILNTGVLELQGGINVPEQIFLGASGTITVAQANGNLRGRSGTSNTISNFVAINDTSNIGVDSGGTLSITQDLVDNTGTATFPTLNKVGGGQLNVKNVVFPDGAINVQAGTVSIAANGTNTGTSKVNTLTIAGGTALDLNDNDLVVVTTPKATIEALVANVRNNPGVGAWGGSGITSSSARVQPNSNTGLGVLSGAEYTSVGGTGTFSGQAYGATDTLVKYTWNGDANFSGTVNFDDYVKIDVGFNSGFTGWLNGDFNYSGSVDFDDYVLIDVSFNTQSGTLGRAIQYLSGDDRSDQGTSDPAMQKVLEHFGEFGLPYANAFLAAVPEPTTVGLAAAAAVGMLGRRRRKA